MLLLLVASQPSPTSPHSMRTDTSFCPILVLLSHCAFLADGSLALCGIKVCAKPVAV